MSTTTTKRVVKNSIFMYIRMIVLMCISFYTSRILLQILGIDDFGVYSVVGSIASTFTALKSLFSESIQRFLNVAKGKGSNFIEEQISIFSMSVIVHVILIIVFVLTLEIVGMWLIINKLSIPEGRFDAALWVFQMTVIATAISIISIPFDAVIIANEKMSFYASISIFDGILRLLFVLILPFLPFDNLEEYATLLVLIPITTLLFQVQYCRKFSECKFHHKLDTGLFRQVMALSSWNFIGNICFSLIHEGINMLLNIFGGVVMNASRSIAYQVRSLTNQLMNNTIVAVRPVIMQQSVQKKREDYFETINMISRLSFFTILLPVVPLFVYCPQLLEIWLVDVPENAVLFTRLIMVGLVVRSIHEPINIMNMALGKIRRMMVIEASVMIIFFLIIYGVIRMYGIIWAPFALLSLMEIVIIGTLVLNANYEIGFSLRIFIKRVIGPLSMLTLTSSLLASLFISYVSPNTIITLFVSIIVLLFLEVGLCYFTMSRSEKEIVKRIIKK